MFLRALLRFTRLDPPPPPQRKSDTREGLKLTNINEEIQGHQTTGNMIWIERKATARDYWHSVTARATGRLWTTKTTYNEETKAILRFVGTFHHHDTFILRKTHMLGI
jgi:hypothetical protein